MFSLKSLKSFFKQKFSKKKEYKIPSITINYPVELDNEFEYMSDEETINTLESMSNISLTLESISNISFTLTSKFKPKNRTIKLTYPMELDYEESMSDIVM